MPADSRKNRVYFLYTDVIRKPKNQYLNFNTNPPRSKYAWLTFFRNGYLLEEKAIEYPRQVFDGVNDICGQTLIAVKCAYAGMLQSIYNMSVAMAFTPGGVGMSPISITNLIEEYESLRLSWDEIKISCYADTAIQCRLYRMQYDVCNPDYDDDAPPPPPDPPLDPVTPGTPIEGISPPYDPAGGDDGETVPFPGDAAPVPEYTLRVYYHIEARPGHPALPDASLDFTVPSMAYIAEMRNGDCPDVCVGGIANIPEFTYAVADGLTEILLYTHNTCNLLSIYNQEYV